MRDSTFQQLHGLGTISIPVFQKRKLRHRERLGEFGKWQNPSVSSDPPDSTAQVPLESLGRSQGTRARPTGLKPEITGLNLKPHSPEEQRH
jgi:hypothetical protein